MARLFGKTDGQPLDARDIDEMYAHMYMNLLNFTLDGLGSVNHTNVYTNPFATDTVASKTMFVYGSGSYATLVGSSAPAVATITTIAFVMDRTDYDTAIVRVIGSRALTTDEIIEVSFDDSSNFQTIKNNELHKIENCTGSLVVRYSVSRNTETTIDVVNSIGIYFG